MSCSTHFFVTGSLSDTKQPAESQDHFGTRKGSHPDLQTYMGSSDGAAFMPRNGSATPNFSAKSKQIVGKFDQIE